MKADFQIDTLGPPRCASPLGLSTRAGDQIADYTPDDARVLLDLTPDGVGGPAFERAGPRERVFFQGEHIHAAMVTCGGLCPGLNDIIRGLVMTLWRSYGVRRITGFRYGFGGLVPDTPHTPMSLDPSVVRAIHLEGGTILGSSRGPVPAEVMADTLVARDIDVLFCIGGDGTMRGALKLQQALRRRGLPIAVVGLPKTIDNDLAFIEQTFGFDTSVSLATQAIRAARVEANGAIHGIGVVRLMGRHAGFIAASAALASRDADLVLVPEQPFALDGPRGIDAYLRRVLAEHGAAVVVVAEGAGQDHLATTSHTDASGNPRLGDIGVFLRDHLKEAFADLDSSVKYIDPSYIIRAAPPSTADAIFCGRLAENAVHAAMAGKTGLVIGLWGNRFTHVPLEIITSQGKHIDLDSSFWRSVIDTTGQPALWRA
jgi:6-phosphofructokinase 1